MFSVYAFSALQRVLQVKGVKGSIIFTSWGAGVSLQLSNAGNHVVAKLLEKLRVEFTKSRARQTNDQALVEGKNGSIVRKQMGYGWIAQEEAEKIQAFYSRVLNVYLNYHRPCGYATEVVDRKGKIRKRYDAYLTPYEKLRSLPQGEQYLRPGVTMAELEQIAQAQSDTEYALLVQREKAKLFRSFAPLGTVR
jgi:hypothetical protein